MRSFLRFLLPCATAAIMAGCAGGGSMSAAPTAAQNPGSTAAVSRTTLSDHGWGSQPTPTPPPISASATSLTFASAAAAPQTITFTRTGHDDDGALDIDLSASGIVAITRVKTKDSPKDGWGNNWWGKFGHWDWGCGNGGGDDKGQSRTYTVTPLAAGTVNILVSIKHDGKEQSGTTLTIPVTVGGKAPSVTVGSATIDCTTQTCGSSGDSLVSPKILLPPDRLTIASTTTAAYTITSNDGNCGFVGASSPDTVSGTPPQTTVQVGLSAAGYQLGYNQTAGGIGVETIPCSFTVTDASGASTSVTLSYIISYPVP